MDIQGISRICETHSELGEQESENSLSMPFVICNHFKIYFYLFVLIFENSKTHHLFLRGYFFQQNEPRLQGMKYMFTPEELDLLDSYPDAEDEDELAEKPDLEKLGKDEVKEEQISFFGAKNR